MNRITGEPGIKWYVGIPKSGKTYLAITHALEDSARTKRPILALNSNGVANFEKDFPGKFTSVATVRGALEVVYRHHQNAVIIPDGPADVMALSKAAYQPGRIHFLVDEAHNWVRAGGNSRENEMLKMARHHRHHGLYLYFTTQHFTGDIPDEMVSCAPEFFIFRSTGRRVLDRLEMEYDIPRELVRELPKREFHYHYDGFGDDGLEDRTTVKSGADPTL